MAIRYEWDVEEVSAAETERYEEGDVVDHNRQGSYADCVSFAAVPPPEGSKYVIVLVRDVVDKHTSLVDRAWAYMAEGKLPQHFEDAYGSCVSKVPTRFVREVAKVQAR